MDCLNEAKDWLSNNFLHLNLSKLEALLFVPPSPAALSPVLPPCFSSLVKPTITNLGVILDRELRMDSHISQVVRSCFFQLRRLSKLKPILTKRDLHTVIHAFVISRLDYANSLFYGSTTAATARLQLVQNAAARLLTGTRRREHVTPVLARLHWLPVRFRIRFKILLFVFKSLYLYAPPYLSQLVQPYLPGRSLRSAEHRLLQVPRVRTRMRGERAFSICGTNSPWQ